MTDDDLGRQCSEHADELAELALGVLNGRDRATVLAHVESCPRCSDDLEILSRAADTVVLAAPEIEPPMGFEERLLEQMGVAHRVRPRGRFWRSRWVPAAVAAAAILAALGTGLALTSSPRSQTPERTASAALVENGTTVGHVTVNGPERWMAMTLADTAVHGTVQCVVVTDDGVVHRVGTFVADAGYGAWIAPLHVDPARVRTAEVTSPTGTVIAAASLS